MKLLKWMQNKLNGGQCNQVPNVVDPVPVPAPASYHTGRLLTIGTLGNQTLPENQELRRRSAVNPQTVTSNEEEGSLSPDLTEITPEEIEKLQKDLTKLLKRKTPAPASEIQNADEQQQQPLDRFINRPSNLTIDRTVSSSYSSNSSNIADELQEEIDRTIRVIIGRCNEVCMENKKKKKGIFGKKSVSSLVKKMLLCSGGFGGPPITIREFMQESRMEKLVRTLMHSKKICLQNASRASSTKRILEGTHSTNPEKQDDETQEQEKRVERRKWVKTDSECTMNFSF